jgi:hypothetical protein
VNTKNELVCFMIELRDAAIEDGREDGSSLGWLVAECLLADWIAL